ncbi:MAG: hypothetical protein WC265_03435 [Dysgonamonadaceae bacterium]|jgi:hypothetical protein
MKKLNRYWIAALIMSMLLILQCTSNNNKSLNLKLTKMAENLNLSSPTVLDQHTRFDSAIVTPENIFQYYYTIIYANNPSELLSNQKKELINNMKKAFTTDRSLQVFKDNKVTIQYIYKDTAQNIIDIITIDSEAYN